MRTTALTLFASTLFLSASISGLTAQPTGGPMMDSGQRGNIPFGPGMMFGGGAPGFGMMGPGVSGYGMQGYGMMGPAMMGRGMMRMMLVLIDTDGDGALSLEEFETIHARMFNAMDTDKDGKLTVDEMEAFMGGEAAGPDAGQ